MMLQKISMDFIESTPSVLIIAKPNQFDVLCGKDKTYSKSLGNQAFKTLIDQNVIIYRTMYSKLDKMNVTKQIVSTLKDEYGSKFLRPVTGGWEEISDLDARDKVSHALRFAASGVTKRPRCPRGKRQLMRVRAVSDGSTNSKPNTTDSNQDFVTKENDISLTGYNLSFCQQELFGSFVEPDGTEEFLTSSSILELLEQPIILEAGLRESDSSLELPFSTGSDWDTVLESILNPSFFEAIENIETMML